MIRFQLETSLGILNAFAFPPSKEKTGTTYIQEQFSFEEFNSPFFKETLRCALLKKFHCWKIVGIFFRPEQDTVRLEVRGQAH